MTFWKCYERTLKGGARNERSLVVTFQPDYALNV
jgi:hypothetical protein